jgi:hypothetical protein
MSTYTQARSDGWLPPLALAIASPLAAVNASKRIRSIDARSAMILFCFAWLVGFSGSFAALLVSLAFLAGLHLSTRVVVKESAQVATVATSQPSVVSPTIQDAIKASGLIVQKVELKQPTPRKASTNGKVPATV